MAVSSSLGHQHELKLPQGVIRYRERGSGPPVIFVHGVLVNGDLWRKVVPLTADDCRCICPDMPLGAHESGLDPAAGLTPYGIADLIRDLMDGLGIERATLVGNDSGGAFSQVFAGRYPERVERLVLTNCDTREHFPPTLALKLLMLWARVPGVARELVWEIAQLFRSKRVRGLVAKSVIFDKAQIDDEIFKSYGRPLQASGDVRRDTRKALLGMRKRYTLEAAERLKSCEFPVLLAWGTEDRLFFPVSHAERLAQDLPDVSLKLIPGAKTFVPEDKPGELAALIREHVAQPAVTAAHSG